MHETETVLRTAVNAVITRDIEALPALVADDVVNPVPGTTRLSGYYRGNEEFFNGFFAGPRKHRYSPTRARNGKGDLSLHEIEEVLRAAVNAVITGDTEALRKLVAEDVVNPVPGANQLSGDHKWNEEFFNGFFDGPRKHRYSLGMPA